ncbi:MAG: prepilin-type N-terminal cleavage/methylation domain-containing protein [Magnetococcales bacterium]|nr:prepilin-type N-terminal cleavage/methylation domain-containing protein [Magnetococcales bacterium]MBF0321518.1 prepilin-type N-terminal cleavage/methylation domain-containing protein [Magnetococcales bacterium]
MQNDRFTSPWVRLQTGFTLIELIVFIVVVALGLLAVVPLYLQITVGAKSSREMLQAQYLAQERLEQMLAEKYAGGGFTAVTAANYPNESNINIGASLNFDRTVVIEGASLVGTTLTCNGTGVYTAESYKCLYVRVFAHGKTTILGVTQTMISDF